MPKNAKKRSRLTCRRTWRGYTKPECVWDFLFSKINSGLRMIGLPSVAPNLLRKVLLRPKATEDTILRSEPPDAGSERRMVPATGIEPVTSGL